MIQSVNKYHIYEILSSDGNFYYTIPKYQREYTWSYREWEALYDDISENNDEYFIGSIICIPLGDAINPFFGGDRWSAATDHHKPIPNCYLHSLKGTCRLFERG